MISRCFIALSISLCAQQFQISARRWLMCRFLASIDEDTGSRSGGLMMRAQSALRYIWQYFVLNSPSLSLHFYFSCDFILLHLRDMFTGPLMLTLGRWHSLPHRRRAAVSRATPQFLRCSVQRMTFVIEIALQGPAAS